ncbi:HAD family hydrolase [Demequina aurantiaca]|uniref:HAD family hydrolase n=1 Tax=Demequina aurantiaca TaxID=676200 RepID=UPI003D33D777
MSPSSNPQAVSGVLFDVDDTLVDTKGAFRHALSAVASEYLRTGADVDEVLSFWRSDRQGSYRAHTRGEMDHREQRMRRANDLHAAFGGPEMGQDDYEAWDLVFEQAFRDGWRAHDDAHACLDALEAAGVAYGALSNARTEYQEEKLAAVGLARVPMLVGVDTLGFGKPDARVFLLAAERLGFAPEATAYIGDELDIDAVAATRAGLRGYWLDRFEAGESVATHDDVSVVRIASLSEIPAKMGPAATRPAASVLDGARNRLK